MEKLYNKNIYVVSSDFAAVCRNKKVLRCEEMVFKLKKALKKIRTVYVYFCKGKGRERVESVFILFIAIVAIICILFGISMDLVHYQMIKWRFFRNIWNLCCSQIKQTGVTYKSALKILKSSLGLSMTMISMLLSINSSIAERNEKKIFGLERSKLGRVKYEKFYTLIRRINYLSPVMMIISINLSCCVSGYCVILFSYLSLMVHHCRFTSSFSKKTYQDGVIQKLVDSFSEINVDTDEQLLKYQILVDEIGRWTDKEDAWEEVEELFYELYSRVMDYPIVQRYLICAVYYRMIFWKNKRCNRYVALRIVKKIISKMEGESVHNVTIKETYVPVFWGILKGFIELSDEEVLVEFLKWFFNLKDRSNHILLEAEENLDMNILYEETALILVLLEQRLHKKGIKSQEFCNVLEIAWNYNTVFIYEPSTVDAILRQIQGLEEALPEDIGEEVYDVASKLKQDAKDAGNMSLLSGVSQFRREEM